MAPYMMFEKSVRAKEQLTEAKNVSKEAIVDSATNSFFFLSFC
jgi:hypothetical protein